MYQFFYNNKKILRQENQRVMSRVTQNGAETRDRGPVSEGLCDLRIWSLSKSDRILQGER